MNSNITRKNQLNIVIAVLGLINIGILFFMKDINLILLLTTLLVGESIFLILVVLKNYSTLKLFTYILVLQNIVLIILTNFISVSVFNILLLLKEVYLIFILFYVPIVYLRKIRLNIADILAISILAFLFIEMIISPYNFMAKVSSARELASTLLLYLLGRAIVLEKGELNKYIIFIINFGVIIALFGFLEMALGEVFWKAIGINKFMEYKGMGTYLWESGGIPTNFYTYDFYQLLGINLRRLVSFIAEPTTTGQFLVVPFMFLLTSEPKIIKYKKLKITIIGLAIVFVLGKGAFLILAIAFLYYMNNWKRLRVISSIAYLCLAFVSVFLIINSFSNYSSITLHFTGLVNSIISLKNNPFGLGIGGAGNFAAVYGNSSVEIGESFIGVLIGQLGIVGIVLYIAFYFTILQQLNLVGKKSNLKKHVVIIKGLYIGLIMASFLSQSTMGFIASSLYMIFIGLIISIKENKKDKVIVGDNLWI